VLSSILNPFRDPVARARLYEALTSNSRISFYEGSGRGRREKVLDDHVDDEQMLSERASKTAQKIIR
jgi:hypothetical protein